MTWNMAAPPIEMHKDSIKPGQKVVIVDDLIATGGTVEAAIKMVEGSGRRGCQSCVPDGACRIKRTGAPERVRASAPYLRYEGK